jgi:hypothetical protein
MEPQEYDEILRSLVRIAVHQDTINDRLTASIERIDVAIDRIDRTLAHVEITQARVETLLARMIRHEDNGRDV